MNEPIKAEDKGERYVVYYFDPADQQRKLFGYAENLPDAQIMRDAIYAHATWEFPEIVDRKANAKLPYVYVHRVVCDKPELHGCDKPAFLLTEKPFPNAIAFSDIIRHLDGRQMEPYSSCVCDSCGALIGQLKMENIEDNA